MWIMALSLICVGRSDSYHASLMFMMFAVMSSSLSNSSTAPNVQDIAPKHAGSVFGKYIAPKHAGSVFGKYIAPKHAGSVFGKYIAPKHAGSVFGKYIAPKHAGSVFGKYIAPKHAGSVFGKYIVCKYRCLERLWLKLCARGDSNSTIC